MDTWSSPLTHSVAIFGAIGFILLIVISLTARIWYPRSRNRKHSLVIGRILSAIGGPATYRAIQKHR